MRCVSYTRTTSCKSSESIPTDIIQQQNEQIQKYIQSHGWKLVAKYSDRKRDDNENTAFEEMTMDGISRKFDMVVVNSIDRCGKYISCAEDVLAKTFFPAGIHFSVVQDDFCSIEKSREEIDEYFKEANYYKEKYKDATHNCVAYLVGTKERANDDGEPSGTAGLPMLNVLKKQELSNIIAIVTRYFGGIKLGAGGLTRAYSQAVADALKEANIVEKHLIDVYDVSLDYSLTKKFEHLLKVNDIDCINKEYDEQVTYRLYIDDLSFFDTIQDLTSNRYSKEFIKKEYVPVK